MVEPWHNKVIDFSFQFEFQPNRAQFIGVSFFETDEQGRYLGNWLRPQYEGRKLEAYFFENKIIEIFSQKLKFALEQVLGCEYEGHSRDRMEHCSPCCGFLHLHLLFLLHSQVLVDY